MRGDVLEEVNRFLIEHGLSVLAVAVFAMQVGLPLPSIPVFLAAGALAGAGHMNLAALLGVAVAASLAGNLVWFEMGRHRGRTALNLLCRISLEPDSCVRRTENFFVRHGARSLVWTKFIPGLATLAPALAGLFGTPVLRFLFYSAVGALLWSALYVIPGYLFSAQIEQLALQAARYGSWAAFALGGALGAWIAYKFARRRWLLRQLRVARISVGELKAMMDAGQDVVVVDLRQSMDLEADPEAIPGTLRIDVGELEHRHAEIPRGRDVVLYCACPNEVTSARMALLLRRRGIERVRPLAGGIEAWRAARYPVARHG